MDDRTHQPQRMIEWTGERCVPWLGDRRVIYEHYHRYAFAARFTGGKRVLDLASGEGFGAAMLAARAEEVVGVDLDEDAVAHAREHYARPGLRFETGSITNPELLSGERGFDVITCFAAFEHVTDHAALLRLVRARLAPGGLLLASASDAAAERGERGAADPFRHSELDRRRFEDLLESAFRHVAILKQGVSVGSLILPADPGDPDTSFQGVWAQSLARSGSSRWDVRTGTAHSFLLGLAADRQLPPLPAAASLHAANENSDQPPIEMGSVAAGEEAAVDLRSQRDNAVANTARITDLHQRARTENAELTDRVAKLERLRADAERRADRAETELERTGAELHRARRDAERDRVRVRWLRETGAELERRLAGPPTTDAAETDEPATVTVPNSTEPLVSVIIPVHGEFDRTRRCLRSLADHPGAVPFEVLVVDDDSPDASARHLAACPGVRLVRAEQHLGRIGACNLGARHARGEHLLFLHNDSEVCTGWLDVLLATADSHESIGIVGPALVRPDGTLAECGGIVWADGSTSPVTDQPGRSARLAGGPFGALRDVDYCSGTALLVRAELFARAGGFDERYAPAHYEDADLAFTARAAGYRTVAQPAAAVRHGDGQPGTGAGVREHRELNRRVFVAKWADTLESQHLPEPTPRNRWLARQRGTSGHHGPVVMVLDQRVPRPDRDSGSARIRRLLEQFAGLGCRVLMCPADGAETEDGAEPAAGELEELGITVLASADAQQAFLREAGSAVSLAVLAGPHAGWHFLEPLRTYAPQASVVHDAAGLHHLGLDRQADQAQRDGRDAEATALRRKAFAARELELGLLRSCDVTTVGSVGERDLLSRLEPGADVRVLAPVYLVGREPVSPRGRSGVVFVGSLDHPPNADAAAWAVREIMPRVRARLPETVLHLVGGGPESELRALEGPGVEQHGRVADLDPVYARARVALAPLRFGAGAHGKVGESLAAGVPTVATNLAVEGVDLASGSDVLLAEDAAGLADAVVRLLEDGHLWRRLAGAGRARIGDQFSPAAARQVLEGLLRDAGAPVPTVRRTAETAPAGE